MPECCVVGDGLERSGGWLAGRGRIAVVGTVLLLLVLAAYVGHRSPWGAKHPQIHEGIAMRANSDNDLVLFDAADGTQAGFSAGDTWWESDSASGEGDPPCLAVPLRKVEVQVGLMRVANPSGGWHTDVVWVRCP